MGILAYSELVKEIEKGRIKISPLDMKMIGPASIDLHLSYAFRVFKNPRKNIPITKTSDYKDMTLGINIPKGEYLLLTPGDTVLGITKEKIELPDDICGWIEGRSRFSRLGLLVHISASFMQPGIANHQVLEMSNIGPAPLEIYPDTPICQFIFQRMEGKGRYSGRFCVQDPASFLE